MQIWDCFPCYNIILCTELHTKLIIEEKRNLEKNEDYNFCAQELDMSKWYLQILTHFA